MIRSDPTKGDMGCILQEGKKVAKGDDKKICKCWKQRIFTIYQINKEQFGMSVQIQKWVPQCNMVGPVKVQFTWRTSGGWGPHGWVFV
jgi:hypothetical protein